MKITKNQLRRIIKEELQEATQMSLPLFSPPEEKDERFLTKSKSKLYTKGPRGEGPVWTKRWPSRSEKTEYFVNVFTNGAFEIGKVHYGWGFESDPSKGKAHKAVLVSGNVAPMIQKGRWDDTDLIHNQMNTLKFQKSTLDKALKFMQDDVTEITQAVYGTVPEKSQTPWKTPPFREGALRQIIRSSLSEMFDSHADIEKGQIVVVYSHPGMGLKIPGISNRTIKESDWYPVLKTIAPGSWNPYLTALEKANMGSAFEINVMWALVCYYALQNNLEINGGPGEDLMSGSAELSDMIQNQAAEIGDMWDYELDDMTKETGQDFSILPEMIRSLAT
jgi:hypothetical protein